LVGLEFTWNKFLKVLRVKFHLVTIQPQKQKKFTELRMAENMTIMQYGSNSTKHCSDLSLNLWHQKDEDEEVQ